jgi:ketosteroid isomerase-like protein
MSEVPCNEDQLAIRALIDRWSEAVRREDFTAIRADHDENILMFDCPTAIPFSRHRRVHGYLASVLRQRREASHVQF